MQVTLLYFDGCPNWREAEQRPREAMRAADVPDRLLRLHRVDTTEEAERLAFHGSPTVLINGRDPFADPSTPVGLGCRLYRTAAGLTGAPPVDELTAILRAAR